jgi:hypothetical protein
MMRPPGPLPAMPASDTPRSAANARARGEATGNAATPSALAAPSALPMTPPTPIAPAAPRPPVTPASPFKIIAPLTPSALSAPPALSPSAPTQPITVCTGTSSPTFASCISNTPAAGLTTSMVVLSVSTVHTTSPSATVSPGCLSQAAMIELSTLLPSLGRRMGIGIVLGFLVVLCLLLTAYRLPLTAQPLNRRPTRNACATIVSAGFIAVEDGKNEASTTYRLSMSQALQYGSSTAVAGSSPKRSVPH